MAAHFPYKHLPASGLGIRDPRRPYVVGGLGAGVPIFITTILEPYHDPSRRLARDGYTAPRTPIHGTRYRPVYGGTRSPLVGTARTATATPSRSADPVYRSPTGELVRTLEDDDLVNYAEYSEELEDPNGS